MPRHLSLAALPETLPLFPLAGVLLLPRGGLPLNVFEPRYLALVDDALAADRLIGMIQPLDKDEVLRPRLARIGCAGRITAYRETDDNRYLITLTGICRFELKADEDCASGYRKGACDFSAFAEDLVMHDEQNFPRERLVDALKDYLTQNDLKADWKSILTAPAEALVNALAMMCPFGGAEKQALLEAPSFDDRVSTLVALLEMSVQGGPVTLN
jgi:Lon protease-like protein